MSKKTVCTVKRDKDGDIVVNKDLAFNVLKIVDKGLSMGLGRPIPGKMCVEAAVAYASGESHDDKPSCVHHDLAQIKIGLNDTGGWKNDKARGRGLRRVAIAQLGSRDCYNDEDLTEELVKSIDKIVLPAEKHTCLKLVQDQIDELHKLARRISKVKTSNDLYQVANGTVVDYDDRGEYIPDITNNDDGIAAGYADALKRANPKWRMQKCLELAAEEVVKALKKQKIPGTKYLYLTEGKKAKAKKKSK